MKNMRRLAGVSIFLILTFMVIALLQYQNREEVALLPNQFELNLDEEWTVVSLDAGGWTEEPDRVPKLVEEALAEGRYHNADLPYLCKSGEGDVFVFGNRIPKEMAGLTLSFTSPGAEVRVLLDGEELYRAEASEKKSGNGMHFVGIPNVFPEGELWIELTPAHEGVALTLEDVKIESRDMVIIGFMVGNIADIICCLLIMIMTIIMFVLALIRRYTHQPARGELFLGLVGLSTGIYCFIRTDTLNIFYNAQEAYEMQEYLVLLFPLFLTMYFERNFHTIYPRRFSTLLWGMIFNAVGQILLQSLGVCALEDMVLLSAAAIGVLCVTALVSLLRLNYKSRKYQTLLSAFSVLVLFAGGVVNVVLNNFFEGFYGNTAGLYSMAVFSVVMAFMHTLQISKEYRESAERNASLLEEKVRTAEAQNRQLALAKKDAEEARSEALAANEAKGKFLAHMSHEIRTPINAVLGMDEMILRESGEPAIREYAMDIYMAGQTLLSLINDILDFSKIDSGKMEIVPAEYDFSSMIHDLANMTVQRAKDKEITFEAEVDHEIPSRLYGDDVRIRQVLTNILTNAVKYTPQGFVRLRVKSRGLGELGETVRLRFEVEDTGIGIKEEDLPRLSVEFERIEEDRNRHIEGTGLGISITIQLLTLMGSRLQVESTYGEGSKFYFELEQKVMDPTPVGDFESRIHQIAQDYHYSSRICAPEAEILVVDDNAVNRKVLRNLLKETRVRVTDASGGEECLELVQKNHYDLIFLDHMMPGMDGIETLHRLKALEGCPCVDTPVVVLTANAVSGAKERYLSEGFDDFLSKPVVPEKLENMLRRMLPSGLLREEGGQDSLETASREEGRDVSLEDLPQVEGLDWHYAWLHLPDMGLLEYTLKEFYAQIDSAADNLEEAWQSCGEPGYLDRYRILVHAMKGLAATVGIIPLAGLAGILERAAREGRTDAMESATAVFLEEWRGYRRKLEGVFGIGAGSGRKVEDYSIICALLEMVRMGMEEMDIDQADQAAGRLREYEYPEEIAPNIQKLAEAVTNLDSEEADRLAGLLSGQIAALE